MSENTSGIRNAKSEEDPAPYNPLTMLTHESTRISVEKQRKLPEHLLRLLLITAGVAGTVWSFSDFFRLGVRVSMIVLICTVFAAITRFLFRFPKHGLLFLLCECAMIPLIMTHWMDIVSAGAENIFSKMMCVVTHQTAPAQSAIARTLSAEQCTEITLVLICMILVLILEFSENSRMCF